MSIIGRTSIGCTWFGPGTAGPAGMAGQSSPIGMAGMVAPALAAAVNLGSFIASS